MTDRTHFMLCTVFACVGGYPDEVMQKYVDVFQIILDNDKYLQGYEWESHRYYEHNERYFGKKGGDSK